MFCGQGGKEIRGYPQTPHRQISVGAVGEILS